MSPEFHELLNAALSAAVALGASDTPSKTDLSYSTLNLAREVLVKYVERLEKKTGVVRSVFLRF